MLSGFAFRWLFAVGLSALLLSGCTTDIAPAARKAGITALHPQPSVVLRPMRIGFDARSGNLSAMISQAIVNQIYAKKLTRLADEMLQHNIDVPQMVRARVIQVLQEEKGFTVNSAADATLALTIERHGFDGAGFSMSKDVPFIVIQAKLLRGGEKLWSGEGHAHPLRSGGLGATLEEYDAQPELLRKHWEIQLDRAVRQLLTANK